jgi:hypothetical protein
MLSGKLHAARERTIAEIKIALTILLAVNTIGLSRIDANLHVTALVILGFISLRGGALYRPNILQLLYPNGSVMRPPPTPIHFVDRVSAGERSRQDLPG